MRGIHTGEWTAHIFEYAMSFEGNMTQVRELAAANGVGVLHPHGAWPPIRLVSSSATLTRPSHAPSHRSTRRVRRECR
ncbi:phosphoserine phosphatase [Cutibacterium acnes JCM 18916]|nr:phosphoserine phosphatase [Cutibacterium acnes JCM 18916]